MRYLIVSFLCFVCTFFVISCSAPQTTGQMEITAASDEAKDLFFKAREKFDNVEMSAAVTLFDQAIETDPNFGMAHLYRARLTNDPDKRWDHLNKAVALTNQLSEGESEFILFYEAAFKGDGENQKLHLNNLEHSFSDDRYVLNELGSYYYGFLNDYNRALSYFSKLTKIAPNYGPTYNMIGYCNIELENFDAAESALKKYIELTPDSPNPYDSYAELLLTLGKFDQSTEYYQMAYDKDNSYTTALSGIGNNYVLKGEFEKAREYYERVHTEASRSGEKFVAITSIIISYVEEGNIDKAIEICEKRYKMAEGQGLINYMVSSLNSAGFILCENNKIDGAKKYFDRAVKIVELAEVADSDRDAYNITAGWNKCYVLGAENKIEEANVEADKCYKIAKKRGTPFDIQNAHSQLATLELKKGNYQKALDHLKDGFTDSPYDWYQTAEAYEALNMSDKSKEMYQQVANQNEVRLELAVVRNKAKAKL